jgi:peptide chain release factor 1
MFEKLEATIDRYDEISKKLSDPSIINNQEQYKKLMKEFSTLEEVVNKYKEYKKIKKDYADAKEMIREKLDDEMKEMVQMEIEECAEKLERCQEELKVLLLPKDPNDDKSVIMEIRGGAGGEEAALFAAVLYRLYSMYAERQKWSCEIIDSNPTEIGGFKEIVFSIEGKGAYSKLKFESGVHRVQRVPTTETQGRIHTSTVTVAVLPEVEDVDVELNPNDLQIDTYRAGGAGGQHVNKTDSAIRLTHLPTGLVVTCQDERSQHKNKEKALKVLRSKLYDIELEKQAREVAADRKSQVGTGDRSERIRTYNYPQKRVTDHRINYSVYKFEDVLNGFIDELLDALITADTAKKLANAAE